MEMVEGLGEEVMEIVGGSSLLLISDFSLVLKLGILLDPNPALLIGKAVS
jgi:hypothetical protein